MAAARKVVELYAVTRTPLLLPVLEAGLAGESWRNRESCVTLLGELLFKIAGTSGKACFSCRCAVFVHWYSAGMSRRLASCCL